MSGIKDMFQGADWKTEKHVPVIDAPDSVKKGEPFKVVITIGKAVAHPNTTAHHIRWATAFFLPDGEKFLYQIGRCEFLSHGESTQGADTSSVYTNPETLFNFRTDKPGMILVSSYCNIHGLWENSKRVEVK